LLMSRRSTHAYKKNRWVDEKRASFKPIYPRFIERVSVKNLYQGNRQYDGSK